MLSRAPATFASFASALAPPLARIVKRHQGLHEMARDRLAGIATEEKNTIVMGALAFQLRVLLNRGLQMKETVFDVGFGLVPMIRRKKMG